MIEIVIVALLIKWFLVILIYLSIIVIDMFYMFMYIFNYIMFIIVMVMSCGIVSDITCVMFFFVKY